MATLAVAGYGGVATDIGAEVLNWSIDLNVEAVDASYMATGDNKGWREFISGLEGATGTAEVQGATAPVTGAKTAISLSISEDGHAISGNIIITKVTTTTPVDGKVTWSAGFNFTGAVTAAVPG